MLSSKGVCRIFNRDTERVGISNLLVVSDAEIFRCFVSQGAKGRSIKAENDMRFCTGNAVPESGEITGF